MTSIMSAAAKTKLVAIKEKYEQVSRVHEAYNKAIKEYNEVVGSESTRMCNGMEVIDYKTSYETVAALSAQSRPEKGEAKG